MNLPISTPEKEINDLLITCTTPMNSIIYYKLMFNNNIKYPMNFY